MRNGNETIVTGQECIMHTFTGFLVWSVRKWVSAFLQSIVGAPLDDIDDETVNLLLSSEQGKHARIREA